MFCSVLRKSNKKKGVHIMIYQRTLIAKDEEATCAFVGQVQFYFSHKPNFTTMMGVPQHKTDSEFKFAFVKWYKPDFACRNNQPDLLQEILFFKIEFFEESYQSILPIQKIAARVVLSPWMSENNLLLAHPMEREINLV